MCMRPISYNRTSARHGNRVSIFALATMADDASTDAAPGPTPCPDCLANGIEPPRMLNPWWLTSTGYTACMDCRMVERVRRGHASTQHMVLLAQAMRITYPEETMAEGAGSSADPPASTIKKVLKKPAGSDKEKPGKGSVEKIK